MLLWIAPAWTQTEQTPAVDGYVTRYVSRTDFDVNGLKVILAQQAFVCRAESSPSLGRSGMDCSEDYTVEFGDHIKVYGERHEKKELLAATKLIVLKSPATTDLHGSAVIDLMLNPGNIPVVAGQRLVRADGYSILITPDATVDYQAPLKSMDDVTTNVWIAYEGRMREDGVVFARRVKFAANIVKKGEDRLRTEEEFDPAAVNEADKQSGASKFLMGLDEKRIPADKDAAKQARVEIIGRKLIPEYQNKLPDGTASKLHFRFQVVDSKLPCAWTESNGIILVSKSLVERMENDSQLAAVLGAEIAGVLEKQEYILRPKANKLAATYWSGIAAGLFIPGAGIGTAIVTSNIALKLLREDAEQRARVSLDLMHDAGYNLTDAPRAYWLINSLKPKPVARIEMPNQSRYLYDLLQTPAWRNILSSSR